MNKSKECDRHDRSVEAMGVHHEWLMHFLRHANCNMRRLVQCTVAAMQFHLFSPSSTTILLHYVKPRSVGT